MKRSFLAEVHMTGLSFLSNGREVARKSAVAATRSDAFVTFIED